MSETLTRDWVEMHLIHCEAFAVQFTDGDTQHCNALKQAALCRHWLATHSEEARTACGSKASVANEESQT